MSNSASSDGAAGEVDRLYAHSVWSNRRVVAHLQTLPRKALAQELTSVFPSVLDVLRHMYRADELWLDVMNGLPSVQARERAGHAEETVRSADLEQLGACFEDVAGRYRAFLRRERWGEAPVVWSHPRAGRLETSAAELLRHVCHHGTYHRGNITAMLRQMGHPGVPTDYVLFLLEQQTAGWTG